MRAAVALTLANLMGFAAPLAGQEAGALDPRGAEQRLRDYVRVWEADDRVSARAMEKYYADSVVYYGKSMRRSEVLGDKLQFIRAFPHRTYNVAPGTLRTSCKAGQCVARAVLTWRRARADGRARSGASMLTLVFSAAKGGRIVRESARDLRPGG